MSDPKRHHWWPQLQSGLWCGPDETVAVVDNVNGRVFRTSPYNIGVEGQLYSFTNEFGETDASLETWLAKEVDDPFDKAFPRIFDLSKIERRSWPRQPTRHEMSQMRDLGYNPRLFDEILPINNGDKQILSNYVAALLVRNPKYLGKLMEFHKDHVWRKENVDTKHVALANMTYLYDLYRGKISQSELGLEIRDGEHEFLFADAGIVAQEPWRSENLPFDLHVPLTPDLALEVIPISRPIFRGIWVTRAGNKAIARQNRIVLGAATSFAFSRGQPPVDFIKKHFGKPPPDAFGYRFKDGKLETRYFPERDD